jgi:hypothetical protein
MKKTLLISAMGIVMLAVSVQAQLPKNARDGSVLTEKPTISPKLTAVDITVTFTNGTTANLFNTLNAGNSVLLDQFFTT